MQPLTVYLAKPDGTHVDETLMQSTSEKPALLVSYVYVESFMALRSKMQFRSWVMDSGAFSAKNSGKVIDLVTFTQYTKQLQKTDPLLDGVFALDVIGDYRASLRNYEYMTSEGADIIPTYHCGEPWGVLSELAKCYDKIALGGAVGLQGRRKIAWAAECFRRVWPKKIHGLGFGSQEQLNALPFHSVDSTNWALPAVKFGNWRSLGQLRIRGSNQNLQAEVQLFLKMEREARTRWRREMKMLEELE